jgi:hypothetical protein
MSNITELVQLLEEDELYSHWSKPLADELARLASAEQERDGLLGVLRDITPDGWMQNESGDYCPVCDGVAGKHEADCKLAAALKGA